MERDHTQIKRRATPHTRQTTSHSWVVRSSLNTPQPQSAEFPSSTTIFFHSETKQMSLKTLPAHPTFPPNPPLKSAGGARRVFSPSRKCSVMSILVFTGRCRTRPVGWSRRAAGPRSAPGCGPGRAAPPPGGSPGPGGGRPDRAPSWAPCPSSRHRIHPSGKSGSWGLGWEAGGWKSKREGG